MYGGTFFRMMGAYQAYVGLKNYDQALRHHLEAIKDGYTVCIFPMGKIYLSHAQGHHLLTELLVATQQK